MGVDTPALQTDHPFNPTVVLRVNEESLPSYIIKFDPSQFPAAAALAAAASSIPSSTTTPSTGSTPVKSPSIPNTTTTTTPSDQPPPMTLSPSDNTTINHNTSTITSSNLPILPSTPKNEPMSSPQRK